MRFCTLVHHNYNCSTQPSATSAARRTPLGVRYGRGHHQIIVRQKPWAYRPHDLPFKSDGAIGLDTGQVQLVMLPLYHAGFTTLYHGLALNHTIVVMERFVPALFPQMVE